MGPHIGDKPDKFDDVWTTENDLARRWGTKEYFKRVDRDGWHTDRDSLANGTRRIKSDVERIKADARRIKADAERMTRDAKKIAESARRAATKVMGPSHTHTVSGSFDWQNLTKPTNPSHPRFTSSKKTFFKNRKKKKRRFKLSSKSGGIGIGTIIFWGMLLFWFCGDDKADKTAEVVDTSTDNEIINKVKEAYNNIKPEAEALINKAKSEFNKTVSKEKSIKTPRPPKASDDNNRFAQEDDRFGSIEDKW
jgi:gas vesicle protein